MATPIPSNVAAFHLSEVLEATGGRLQGALDDTAHEVVGVGTDTRSIRPGQAFVALVGEHFDGHDHAAAAVAAGASMLLVEREVEVVGAAAVVRVESTLEALGQLAKFHLERWRRAKDNRRVAALTGSAGKTTTKRAIVALLEAMAPGAVCSAPGNLNNRIGVPMTLLTLADQHRVAVLELGTNQPGEIGALAKIVQPDVGLLTLIASAHSEGLGGIEAIAQEKAALYAEVRGTIVGNVDDARIVKKMRSYSQERCLGYGRAQGACYRIVARKPSADGLRSFVELRGRRELSFETPLVGEAGALASAAALAVCESLSEIELSAAEIAAAFATIRDSGPGRLRPMRTPRSAIVVDDSYNANPASSRNAIRTARELADVLNKRLGLVLGDMRELGEQSAEEHRALAETVLEAKPAWLVTVGRESEALHLQAKKLGLELSHHFADARAAASWADAHVLGGDLVLVKGSRGVATERVVQTLMLSKSGGADRQLKAKRRWAVAP